MDHISELPDEILSHILTMLPVKDLLKTSLLSRRWCKLWFLRRDLHFDIFHVLGKSEQEVFQIRDSSHNSIMERRRVQLDINMDEFVKRVDQFVKSFQGIKIDSFFVSFYLNGKHGDIIDQWIRFAIARGVETINLPLLAMPSAYAIDTTPSKLRYKFALDLFSDTNASTLKHMRLEHCLVSHPTNSDYIPFKNLRSLSLFRAKVDEIFIESLLSNCRRLEELHLIYCELRSWMPKIMSSSLCHLKVGACYIVSDNSRVNINLISLDCLKLTSLEYIGYSLVTLNINTPLLKSIRCAVHYGEDPNVLALFATLPKLEIMRLDISSMDLTSLKITQPFKHLKQLNIILFSPFETVEHSKFDLLGIVTLLRASPLLHKLSVMITYPMIIENQKVVKDIECTHDEIKVIELRGCVGNWYEIEFVMNVLKYAHKLEEIVLSPYWRVHDSFNWKFDPIWFQDRRQMISEKLQSENVVGREKLVLI
ncbi:F-box/FBD/LRR-repeat protein At1g13570-like [Trifolium pratense]|uniref:F-box/FBD/LRR-repeat protein At1g13570-like n=1 Tax=Trifolium pratense TaxID=57577 RepID=UPI001E691257|nr:F-box/FBD/LRR-repeat protein At1g13570-like [Trifolium pratense]